MIYTTQKNIDGKISVIITVSKSTKAPLGSFVMVEDEREDEVNQIVKNLTVGYKTIYGDRCIVTTIIE